MPAVPPRVVVRLLVLLAAAAGCLDALCVARLGGPFSSVITGNLVQLGLGVARPDARLALVALVAVASFAVGVSLATIALRGSAMGWRGRTSMVGFLELVLVVGVAVGWQGSGGQPGTALATTLLGLAAAAMGVQSVLTLSTGLPEASTTYLTGTLTSAVQVVTARADPLRRAGARGGAARLVALLAGAVIGGVVLRFAPLWTPVVSVALIGTALLVGAVLLRNGSRAPTETEVTRD